MLKRTPCKTTLTLSPRLTKNLGTPLKNDILYIRDLVNNGAMRVEDIPSNQQLADGFTKVLGIEAFYNHKNKHKLVPTIRETLEHKSSLANKHG